MRGNLDFRFPNQLETGRNSIAVGPAVYREVSAGTAAPVRCLVRGLWLAESDGIRFGMLIDVDGSYHGTELRVEVAVPQGEQALALSQALMRRVRAAGEAAVSFRGQVLVLEHEPNTAYDAPAQLAVAPMAAPSRDDIILPEVLLQLIERNTLGFAQRMDAFAKLGMSARKGVLLYGPPGTGKTLLVRYLAGQLAGFTTFLVSAQHYGLLGEIMDAARLLQPAMVVLEDIDLVGGDRDGPYQQSPTVLNELLNHMDGFSSEQPRQVQSRSVP